MTKLKDQTMTKTTIFKLGAFILLFAFMGAVAGNIDSIAFLTLTK
jgi:hypothetical protein